MHSFDNQGNATTMYAILEKPGVLKLEDKTMRSILTVSKDGNAMVAKWELLDNGKSWAPWMHLEFNK